MHSESVAQRESEKNRKGNCNEKVIQGHTGKETRQ